MGLGAIRRCHRSRRPAIVVIGWAMAFNTPYQLFKRYASHEGIVQRPLEGTSVAAVLHDSATTTAREAQFYSMFGTRGIWHDGWSANTVHPAAPACWGHRSTHPIPPTPYVDRERELAAAFARD